ncbi:hypothetical protein SERLA73DRAFT_183606 [Serpula lacrymans var. lacrymans S7.3]|uniref:Uncharacterized protein n=2 Tax=Serpula lacrymans var. lacrymans TaxID=341189 RepID=F8Q073_SERL3|nr:uncharacterized protein SERLADRAFT_470874 [Serpula lacrymans var. lacrymans S7.9]EGN98545.1 hypothetical protein SERLA73DRAFT_183606 [Serpula lacrymans var. lacrymans S7.3]EGO24114.1 hypothetical protein SERLADRAFT_470874 [Serpula lacrymans var. lacrymans S7.9]
MKLASGLTSEESASAQPPHYIKLPDSQMKTAEELGPRLFVLSDHLSEETDLRCLQRGWNMSRSHPRKRVCSGTGKARDSEM